MLGIQEIQRLPQGFAELHVRNGVCWLVCVILLRLRSRV
jgi:hypothetical protein